MKEKLKILREKLKENNLDGMIIENPKNIQYLTGIQAEGTLIISKDENTYITDGRYIEDVNSLLTIEDEIIVQDISNLNKDDYFTFFEDSETVGFEENYISYARYTLMLRRYRIKQAEEAQNLIDDMRMIKNKEEIECIEKACNLTDSCFLHLLEYIKEEMTEKQIALEIQKFFIENGADGIAFDTVVATGENSSKPHAIPTDRKVKKGDPILIDFGAKYKGYSADMTRTIFLGEVKSEFRSLYEMILSIQVRSFGRYKQNAETKQIAESVQNEMYTQNYDLIHALGHGVGLDIHEKPYISTKSSYTLKENMVVTNEPGVYIPGKIGIRIEDTVLINSMSATNLTKSNRNLLII